MEYIKVEDCCEILDYQRKPITAKNRVFGEYPYYGANGIQDYVECYLFDDELVLLAEDGGNFGSKSKPIAYRVSGKCWVNNHAHVLKPKEMIDVDYLCNCLKFYDTSGIVNGATRQKLTQSAMKTMTIPYRELIEQKKIVLKIKTVECIIQAKQKQIHLLNELIKARFVEMFNGYDKIKLSEIADIVMGQSPDSSSYNDEGDGIPFFQGKADYGEKYTIVKHWTNKPRKLASKGDILMSVRAPVGPVNISSVDCCIGRGLCSIKAHESVTNNEFLYNALKVIENNISSLGTGTTFKAINKKDVYSLMIPNVPFILQEQFSDFVREVDKSKFMDEIMVYKLKMRG